MSNPKIMTLDEMFDQYDRDRAAEEASPVNRALTKLLEERAKRRAEAERLRYIALGWINEDGTPGPNAPADEPEEDDDDVC
jgi:hypothetical protein